MSFHLGFCREVVVKLLKDLGCNAVCIGRDFLERGPEVAQENLLAFWFG